ncbi:glycoside hydrolase family 25 protein [Clostridium polynesiense]|uniref:glycoside hydrolase family 25 protein n=1 Tax=Clostridium polynesiense TaxID=1325933 RepID=UPI00058FCDDF|nr:glycoside hydrolase family 25 protein [Clostridium polynesiense]
MQNRNPGSLFGIDINEYSQNANFQELARTVDFLYLRSSGSGSGRFRVDRKFLEFAKASRDFGIPVGAYHFALPTTSLPAADAQADDFADVLQQGFGQGDYGDLFPVLDVETPVDKSLTTEQLVNWIDRFRRRFENRTRRRLMLYTGAFFIDIYDNFFIPGRGYPLSNMPLWIAMYTSIPGNPPYPVDQGGWTRWRIWQFSEDGKVNGVDPPTDLNWGPNSIDLLRAPRDVSGLRVYEDANNVYANWNPNPDLDLAGYNIFLNGNYVTTLNKGRNSYVISKRRYGITPTSPVTVGVEAFDIDGEFSKTGL